MILVAGATPFVLFFLGFGVLVVVWLVPWALVRPFIRRSSVATQPGDEDDRSDQIRNAWHVYLGVVAGAILAPIGVLLLCASASQFLQAGLHPFLVSLLAFGGLVAGAWAGGRLGASEVQRPKKRKGPFGNPVVGAVVLSFVAFIVPAITYCLCWFLLVYLPEPPNPGSLLNGMPEHLHERLILEDKIEQFWMYLPPVLFIAGVVVVITLCFKFARAPSQGVNTK